MKYDFCTNIEQMAGYTPGFQPDTTAIKLNTNENPYPPSPAVVKALANINPDQLRRYPPIYWNELRNTIAKLHNIDHEMVVCGNGGDEILSMLIRCCCNKDRPVAYPTPTYTLYRVLAQIQNCPVIELPFSDSSCQLPEQLAHTGASLTIVCNPNAPTSSFVSPQEIEKLAQQLNGVLLVDEAYVDFAENSCLPLLKNNENIVILRSLSKGYSLAGMRLGYALTASERIIEAMIKVKDSYNINIATQMAGQAALADQTYHKENVSKIITERARLTNELRQLGFVVPISHTNFVLAQWPETKDLNNQADVNTDYTDHITAKQIYESLCQANIFVRYFDTNQLRDKLRITIGLPHQNDALLAQLQKIIIPKS